MPCGWRAYYSDGSTFASSDVAWAALPPDGLPGVVEFKEPPYRVLHDGYDWIWLEGGEFRTVTTHEKWGQWADPPEGVDPALVKRGAGMEDGPWQALQRRMLEDRDWPAHV